MTVMIPISPTQNEEVENTAEKFHSNYDCSIKCILLLLQFDDWFLILSDLNVANRSLKP